MELRVFGLTGGIGSGKSSVGRRWMERGLTVINADQLARRAVAAGSSGLAQIREHFGGALINEHGELDRARLGELVFSNAEARHALDGIVHPIVRGLAADQFQRVSEAGQILACYEVPLLYEVGLERTLSPIVVVNAPDALWRARLAARDGLNAQQVEARIAAQMPLSEKARRADFVIDNDDSLARLLERADAVLDWVCDAVNVPRARYPRPNAFS